MRSRFKMKITTFDNEPIVKVRANDIAEFDSVIDGLKQKFNGKKRNGR